MGFKAGFKLLKDHGIDEIALAFVSTNESYRAIANLILAICYDLDMKAIAELFPTEVDAKRWLQQIQFK